jgi:hypothetical protein
MLAPEEHFAVLITHVIGTTTRVPWDVQVLPDFQLCVQDWGEVVESSHC